MGLVRKFAVWPVWVLTRILVVFSLTRTGEVVGDPGYYWAGTARIYQGALPQTVMVEYPTPVLWILRVPFAFSDSSQSGFLWAFVVILILIDLGFMIALWDAGRGNRGAWFWVAFVFVAGPIVYARLDLIPAVLCGGAILAVKNRRESIAGAFLALGAGLKLWPALLWPTTLRGSRRSDRRVSVSFFLIGIVLVVFAIWYAGIGRLFSPLGWQSGRGLQIESVWATVLMASRVGDPNAHPIGYSHWQAYEIFGPGVDSWLGAATVITYLSYLLIVAAYIFWLRKIYPGLFSRRPSLTANEPVASMAEVALFASWVIIVTLIANKTFSPQYLVWLAAPVAVLIGSADSDHGSLRRHQAAGIGIIMVILGGLTQLIYPQYYKELLEGGTDSMGVIAALVTRNLGILAIGVWLSVLLWTALKRPRHDPEVVAEAQS